MKKSKTLFFIASASLSIEFSSQSQSVPQNLKSLNTLILPSDITLIYSVTKEDVRSKILRNGYVDLVSREERSEAAGKDSKSRSQTEIWIKRLSAQVNKVESPQHFKIMLSIKGDKVIYRLDGRPQSAISVYNGKFSFRYKKKNSSTLESGRELLDGYGALQDALLPLAAPGLPFVPLIKTPKLKSESSEFLKFSCYSPVINRRSTPKINDWYTPSEVTTEISKNGIKIRNCVLFYQDQPGRIFQRWEYQNHMKFAGVWLAKRMIFTDYMAYLVGEKMPTGPEYKYTYDLVSAKEESLPSNFFEVTSWMNPGEGIQDSRSQKITAFTFGENKGNLEQQIKRAQWEQSQGMAKKKVANGESSNLSGVLLLVGLSCGVGAWLWRRQQSALG